MNVYNPSYAFLNCRCALRRTSICQDKNQDLQLLKVHAQVVDPDFYPRYASQSSKQRYRARIIFARRLLFSSTSEAPMAGDI